MKHAEFIHAWADDKEIEQRDPSIMLCSFPPQPDSWRQFTGTWSDAMEYRIKPEPTETEKLVTELRRWAGDTQVYAAIMFRAAADEIDRLSAERRARDLAIAQAVDKVYCDLVPIKQRNSVHYLECIIATVKDQP